MILLNYCFFPLHRNYQYHHTLKHHQCFKKGQGFVSTRKALGSGWLITKKPQTNNPTKQTYLFILK